MSGALFDMKKLEWWAKENIAQMPVDTLVQNVIDWAQNYADSVRKDQVADVQYLRNVLSIERDNQKRIRKDFITWRQTLDEVAYFWDNLFVANKEFEFNKDTLNEFLSTFNIADDKDTWWNKIVEIANRLGVKNGDVAMNLRVALTGRTNTPDLYSVMQVMGENRVKERVKGALK